MRFTRVFVIHRDVKWTHSGYLPHRVIERNDADKYAWEFGDHFVILVQRTPRGLWYISPVPGLDRLERELDKLHGGQPLRVWLTRLMMGV